MATVVVTGSASGIGAAVSRRFVDDGAQVVGIDIADADVQADLSPGRRKTKDMQQKKEIRSA